MIRRFLLAVATTVVLAVPASAEDIIIESRREGKNHPKYSERTGKWLDSNTPAHTAKSSAPGLTPQSKAGSRKVIITGPFTEIKDEVIAAARFSPNLDSEGHYYVTTTFPKSGNATPINVIIKHADGETALPVTQDGWGALGPVTGDKWITLGDFDFNAGRDQYVEFQATGATKASDTRTPGQMGMDAVRFSSEPVPGAAALDPASSPATAGIIAPAGATASAASPPDSGPIAWSENLTDAQSRAASENKKIFVFFVSAQSARSSNYESTVLSDPRIKEVLKSRFLPVRINLEQNRELTTQLQVFRAGTINIYDERGNGLKHLTETPNAEDLLKELSRL